MSLITKPLILVCGTLTAGGAERVLSVLSQYLLNYFSKVEIILWRKAPQFYQIDERICVITIPDLTQSKNIVTHCYWFRKYVKQLNPYGVVSFLAPFNILTIMSLWGCHIPVLIADRNDPRYDCPNIFWRWLRDTLYRYADRLCVQTQANKEYFAECIRVKTDIIYNPAFLNRDLIGLALKSSKQNTIVSVGRLIGQKNFFLLLEAFAEVCTVFPEYRLIIYGEGILRKELEDKIEQLNLVGKVDLPGNQKNIHELLLSADLFVMSSDFEGMPNALIEAMCLGLPCISTKVSGAVDLIQDKVNGYLVNRGDCNALITAMSELIIHKEKKHMIAEQAARIVEILNIDIVVKQWLEFINKGVES